jgi:outer membrane immunogenic protein
MKRLCFATTVAAALAGPAMAADLGARPYTKAPVIAAVAYDWSGFYLGLNGGGGWSHKCWDLNAFGGLPVNPVIPDGCSDGSGAVAGGQIGYRWQSSAWVFGVEAQGDWANLKGSNTSLALAGFAGGLTNQSRVNGIGLFTGQVGYAWNNVLLYVKGGAAVTADKYNELLSQIGPFPAGTVFAQASETRWGGAAGVGIEFGFAPNWSAGVEYDHLFMGSRNVTETTTGATGIFGPAAGTVFRTDNIRQDVDMVTARINYRFGGPVVARY